MRISLGMSKAETALGIFGLVVAIPVLVLMWSGDDTPAAELTQAEKNRGTAQIVCQEAIKRVLNDPNSAEWGQVYNWPAGLQDNDDSRYLVQPEIRATNGFGGKVLTRFECVFNVLPDGNVAFASVSEI